MEHKDKHIFLTAQLLQDISHQYQLQQPTKLNQVA